MKLSPTSTSHLNFRLPHLTSNSTWQPEWPQNSENLTCPKQNTWFNLQTHFSSSSPSWWTAGPLGLVPALRTRPRPLFLSHTTSTPPAHPLIAGPLTSPGHSPRPGLPALWTRDHAPTLIVSPRAPAAPLPRAHLVRSLTLFTFLFTCYIIREASSDDPSLPYHPHPP